MSVRAFVGATVLLLSLSTASCPARPPEPRLPAAPIAPLPRPPAEHGPPLEFVLDPVDRAFEHRAESEALRGHRAVVLLLATYDVGSLMALRTLAPLLGDLPKDAACLQVAMQPLGDRELIGAFFDAEKTPCRRAIGDPKRGRLGDLGSVKVIPAVIVLRADGTVAGSLSGSFGVEDVRALLERAR